MKNPHISNITVFDANKIVVREEDGASHFIKIEIHGSDDATTTITCWRKSGCEAEAPELVVRALHKAGPIDSDGESDP